MQPWMNLLKYEHSPFMQLITYRCIIKVKKKKTKGLLNDDQDLV